MEERCGPLVFLSDFDSGNLARAEFVEPVEDPDSESKSGKDDVPPKLVFDYEFNVWTKPDCMGTEFVNGNRTWFYFGVKAGPAGKVIRINVMNLNRQNRLYSQGMVPVVKVAYATRETSWERLRSRVTYQTVEGNFILSFTYKLPESRTAIVYFAFCFPFSYTECQALLAQLEEKHSVRPFVKPLEYMIYFHRELLCYSYEGRRIDLITITSCSGISRQREDRIYGLFPDASIDRPHRFHGKKVYFLTARVHPGETPSSFVFNGFIDFILNEKDPRAHMLRQLFVFKLIPMINPDGVYNGFYRTDTRGVNLNRVYLNPDRDLHPSVYAIKSLILYHHEKPDIIQLPEFGISSESCSRYTKPCVENLALGFGEKSEGSLKQLSDYSAGNAMPLSDVDGAHLQPWSEDACLSQPLNSEVENHHEYGDDKKFSKKKIVNSLKDSRSEICHDTSNNEILNRRNNFSLNLRPLKDSVEKAGDVNGELGKFSNPLQPEYSEIGFLRSSNICSDVNSGNDVRPLQCGDGKLFMTTLEHSNNCNVTNGSLLDSTRKDHYFKQDNRNKVSRYIDCSVRFPNVVSTSDINRLDSFAVGKPMEGRANCDSGKIIDSCNSSQLDLTSSRCPVFENSFSPSASESGYPDIGNALRLEGSVLREVACVNNCKHEGADDLKTRFEHNKELSSCEVPNNAYRCNENATESYGREANSLKVERSSSLDVFDRGSGDFDNKSTNPLAKMSNVAYYIDLHGHASKRGCFIYANHMENFEDQSEALLFPKLMSINSQNFDFEACNFSLRNMTLKDKRDGLSKEGSGRVAIYRAIGLIHSYTLECNYNTGRIVNSLPPAANSNGRTTPPLLSSLPPKYTPEIYAQVGRALAISALDVLGANPWSRIPASDFRSLKGIRQWLGVYIRSTHNPVQASKKIGRSKTKDDIQAKGSVAKKIEPPRNTRKSQTATDKKPISLVEHRMKDLSLELANSKNNSIPLIEGNPTSERKKIPKQTIELRFSRMESKTYQEKKERNKSLPFLGLQQKPIEAVSAKEQTLTRSQSLLKKEMASKYKLKTMPKVVNRPVRKTFTKSMQTLENKDLKKRQVRCEKTKI